MDNNTNRRDFEDEIVVSTDEEEIEHPQTSSNTNVRPTNNIPYLLSFIFKLTNPFSMRCKEYITYQFDQDKPTGLTNSNSNVVLNQCSEDLGFLQRMDNLVRRILWFFVKGLFKILHLVQRLIVFTYVFFILMANLPFSILKNLVLYLKCYTSSSSIFYIPIKLLPAILWHIWTFLHSFVCSKSKPKSPQCKSRCFNDSNNAQDNESNIELHTIIGTYDDEETIDIRKVVLLISGCIILIVASYSYINYNPKVSLFNPFISNVKSLFGQQLRKLYFLPGENCMKAGRCCKGTLEAIFRWSACVITIPIRVMLSVWPKANSKIITKYSGIDGVQYYINKIITEINELKEEIDQQRELITNLQAKFIDLDLKVYEKVNSIDALKPKVLKSKENIEEMKKDVHKAMTVLKYIINIRNDIDKLLDSVKMEAEEATNAAKQTIIRLQSSIEAEQRRLQSQIEHLEFILQEDRVKLNNKNQRILQRIFKEIDQIKMLQIDIKKRIVPLLELPMMYKHMSDGFQKEIRNKLNEEMVYHEQMSKRTENHCASEIEKLEQGRTKVNAELNCLINNTIRNEARALANKLRKDISDTLYERTQEIARIITEQALSKQSKTYHKLQKKVKKCGLFAHVFRLDTSTYKCLIDDICYDQKREVKGHIDVIIDEALRVLAADDIGITDYALESSGGSVISDRSSATYTGRAAFLSLFGFTFGKVVKSIRKVIQPGTLPGDCWAFKNDRGHIVIRLSRPIVITSVTIDHVSPLLTPDGRIMSAPKSFSVYALSSYEDYTGVNLGEFQYSKYGSPIQTFNIVQSYSTTQYVKVDFLSNHGNQEYSCIYRIRVHGHYNEAALST